MTLDTLERAQSAIREAGIDIALVSSIANVTYVTGVEVPLPVGAGYEMAYAPWLAVLTVNGAGLVSGGEAGGMGVAGHGFDLFTIEGFDHDRATDPAGSYAGRLKAALIASGVTGGSGTIGVELRSLSFVAGQIIRAALPNWTIVDIEPAMIRARWIKTPREIELLRTASAVSDVAQRTLAELVRTSGRSEINMYTEITRRTFEAAGGAIQLAGELVTGPRTTVVAYPAGPKCRTTEPGDAALMDLSGRVNGYWFDCTNTHVIGGAPPTEEQRRYAKASQAACEAGMAALKPGNKASDASRAAAAAFASFGLANAHYTGHQIGVTVNELPRLVPYDDSIIEPGMVFSVEPGAYQGPGGTFGSRSEKMVLVRADGPEILSQFDWGI
ncbi:MAG TPA: Xaa-Pro peptidase family protein [Thermomicrobiales bacterium]|nr:Xaa-Pro peptidase family protein [Thermomicrobiales bacterium]